MNTTNPIMFDPILYPIKIWVVVNRTPSIIEGYFNDADDKPMVDTATNLANAKAFAMKVIDKDGGYAGVVLYFRNKKDMDFNLVAHESCHAARFVFDYICAEINDHEPFEYLVGWIAGCCEKVKKGKL